VVRSLPKGLEYRRIRSIHQRRNGGHSGWEGLPGPAPPRWVSAWSPQEFRPWFQPPSSVSAQVQPRLWPLVFGKSKPQFNLFLWPFHSEVTRFYGGFFFLLLLFFPFLSFPHLSSDPPLPSNREKGINGQKEILKGLVLTGTMDSPTKADVQQWLLRLSLLSQSGRICQHGKRDPPTVTGVNPTRRGPARGQ